MEPAKTKKRRGSHRDYETHSAPPMGDRNGDGSLVDIASVTLELVAERDFKKYRDDLLGRVPTDVRSRFREGRFCRWGKEWLPVLELGPFDVEPGPVRDMWLEMFENSQKRGRGMKRLVYWYGVQYEDRGQAYSFVTATQLIAYEEGKQRGYGNIPKKMQNKVAQKHKFSKKEEQLNRGLMEIEADMQQDKSERAKWMMQFKETYEIAEEESLREAVRSRMQSMHEEAELSPKSKKAKVKRKLGRSKKEENGGKFKLPDGVVSASASFNGNNRVSPSKRARNAKVLPPRAVSLDVTASEHCTDGGEPSEAQESIKKEPMTETSSSIPTCGKDELQTGARRRLTPAECNSVVRELGKLHPDVIASNNRRRELFALRGKQPFNQRNNISEQNGRSTPITDAIINTMLSQNTTAANQNKAFASLKKAFPGGWDQVASETDATRIEDAIRVAGLAQRRAERMQTMLRTVRSERGEANFEFLQDVRSSEDVRRELSRHKGMGPKTISCVLLFALGRPDFPVDTHVLRISKQMGWVSQSLSREAAYEFLNGVVPDQNKLDLHCLLVAHGKQCNKCAARGRAQFPPKEQWVCPMAAIKSGKLATADTYKRSSLVDKKRSIVKEENRLASTPPLKSEEPTPEMSHSNLDVKVKVENVTPWCDC